VEYRDEVYFDSTPENEAPFAPQEFSQRLTRLRHKMAAAKIDLLYLMAPESMYYLSGYQAEWYQAQSPQQWPASSAIAVHVDHDHYILFDSEREAVLGRVFTHSVDTRYFPRTALRGSADFVVQELRREGWLKGSVGLEFRSYRPNRIISQQLESAFLTAGANVCDGTQLLREVRWVKSAAEVECLKQAAKIANIGMTAAKATIGAGVTELEVYGEMIRAMARAGGRGKSRHNDAGSVRHQNQRSSRGGDAPQDEAGGAGAGGSCGRLQTLSHKSGTNVSHRRAAPGRSGSVQSGRALHEPYQRHPASQFARAGVQRYRAQLFPGRRAMGAPRLGRRV
jgi:hypothetical protein